MRKIAAGLVLSLAFVSQAQASEESKPCFRTQSQLGPMIQKVIVVVGARPAKAKKHRHKPKHAKKHKHGRRVSGA